MILGAVGLGALLLSVLATTANVLRPDTHPAPEVSWSPMPRLSPTTRQLDCAASPHECGFPDATNTGPRVTSDKLRAVPDEVTSGPGWSWDPRGWLSVNSEGAILENVEVHGNVDVVANNVLVRDVRVVASGDTFGISLRRTRGTTIENTSVSTPDADSERLLVGIKDIHGDSLDTKILRNDISGTATGIQLYSGLIEGNYVHDLGYTEGDHVNGILDTGGAGVPLVIHRNTVFNPHAQTDAIGLFQDFGPQKNRVVSQNLLAGGGYSLYAGADSGGSETSNIKIFGNRFSRHLFENGGRFGPVAFLEANKSNIFVDNFWDDTGARLNP